jgi:hypothetical protein
MGAVNEEAAQGLLIPPAPHRRDMPVILLPLYATSMRGVILSPLSTRGKRLHCKYFLAISSALDTVGTSTIMIVDAGMIIGEISGSGIFQRTNFFRFGYF